MEQEHETGGAASAWPPPVESRVGNGRAGARSVLPTLDPAGARHAALRVAKAWRAEVAQAAAHRLQSGSAGRVTVRRNASHVRPIADMWRVDNPMEDSAEGSVGAPRGAGCRAGPCRAGRGEGRIWGRMGVAGTGRIDPPNEQGGAGHERERKKEGEADAEGGRSGRRGRRRGPKKVRDRTRRTR